MFRMRPMRAALLSMIAPLVCLSCSEAPNTVTIGVIFPMSGDAATYGEKGELGIRLAVEEVNRRNLLGGRTMRTIIEDSQADPAAGAAAMLKLTNINRTPAVVGDIVSVVTLAVAPIAERQEVVLLSPTSSAPSITDAGEFVYRIWPSDLAEGSAIAEAARDLGLTRAAVVHLNNDYGLSIAGRFMEVFEAGGGAIVVTEAYLEETGDYRSVLSRVAARDPDVVYVAGYYRDSALIIRQARELGMDQQLLATTAIEDPAFLELAGEAAEGLIYPLATGFDASSTEPITADFVRRFIDAFGSTPSWVEAHAYEAIMILAQVISEISGPVSGVTIKEGLDSLGEYSGVTGTFSFDSNGDVSKPITMKTITDGAFVSFAGN